MAFESNGTTNHSILAQAFAQRMNVMMHPKNGQDDRLSEMARNAFLPFAALPVSKRNCSELLTNIEQNPVIAGLIVLDSKQSYDF